MNSDQSPPNPIPAGPTQPNSAADTSKMTLRGIWVAIILLAALMASAITSVALLSTDAPLAAAIAAAGATYIGLASLGIKVLKFLTE